MQTESMRFYLGIHQPAWLAKTAVPVFVSRVRLAGRKTLPVASAPWALDSGGFSELSKHGRFTVTAKHYAAEVVRYADEIGSLDFAAIQDHMCEPTILAKTGSTVLEHQKRTVASYLELRDLAPDVPWLPVLQGWTYGDYFDHVEMYARAGVDLRTFDRVGVGSICRRSHHMRAALILSGLADEGLKLHGFGFKVDGLVAAHSYLASADSMAWSFHARREQNGKQNDFGFACEWRGDMLAKIAREGVAA